MMLTDEHEDFRRTVRSFVENEINPYADEWEAAGRVPAHDLYAKMGKLGLLGLQFDPKWGGSGAGQLFAAVMCEELGRCAARGVVMGINLQTHMATPSLARFGSDDLRERYLRPTLAGELIGAIGVSEPDAGSDVAGLRTRAVRDGDDWVISGSKLYITHGTQADWICLLVRTSEEGGHRGISQIIVDTDTPGFSVSRTLDKLGNRSSDTAELVFDQVRVPVSHTIGEIGRGFYQQMQQFQPERMSAAYGVVGSTEYALERTVAYLKQREVFGKPLMDNQYLQFRLAELWAEVDLLRSHNYRCAELLDAGEDISRYASVAKLKAGRLGREVADTCLQFHGGMGYMEENWTSRYYRDTRLSSIAGGADEVMLQVLSKMHGMAG